MKFLQLDLQQSGKTIKEYLHDAGVNYSTYNYWRKKNACVYCIRHQKTDRYPSFAIIAIISQIIAIISQIIAIIQNQILAIIF